MGKSSVDNLSSAAVVASTNFDMEMVDPQPYLDKLNKADCRRYRNWIELDASIPSPAKTTKTYKVAEPKPVFVLWRVHSKPRR